jgi:RNA polymerase sigma-70 factor (ECF subfamily)
MTEAQRIVDSRGISDSRGHGRAEPSADRLFELLLEPCRRPLWTFLARLVRDRSVAEDLYQETLLRAWRALPGYDERGRFSSWLFRIAHNVVRDHRRRRSARPVPVALPDRLEAVDPARADQQARAGEARRRVSEALSGLTEEQRHVFLLRLHSDLTFQAIADLTGAPLSTVINRMRDAMRKLERAMEAD